MKEEILTKVKNMVTLLEALEPHVRTLECYSADYFVTKSRIALQHALIEVYYEKHSRGDCWLTKALEEVNK